MKKIPILLFFLAVTSTSFSQTVNGQWHGYFNEGSNDISLLAGSTEYVLELMIIDEAVTGTSYTYFENRRYYVICNLNGVYNKKTKKIVVNETERVKGSTPPDWTDCLQTHILYYGKQEAKEVLKGEWKTSPFNNKKNGGCGWGATTLSRRLLNNSFTFNKQNRTPVVKKPNIVAKTYPQFMDKNKPESTTVKTAPKTVKPATPPVAKKETANKKDVTIIEPLPDKLAEKKSELKEITVAKPFEKRSPNIIKTIEVEKQTFKVDLYDNGDIDGDTISLFFNGKLVLAHKRLTDKALSVNLDVDNSRDINELVMYAENLGSIPPNTAVMIVTDGENRYEVRIASDLQKSGTIRFVHKPKNTQ
jgi:hypothetical protein